MTEQIQAWVECEDGEPSEGNWYAPTPASFQLSPSDVICPFCKGLMERVSGGLFGRIVRELKEKRGKLQRCVVDVMPPTHEAFNCEACDIVMTRLIEGSE